MTNERAHLLYEVQEFLDETFGCFDCEILQKYSFYVDKLKPYFVPTLEHFIYGALERFVYGEESERYLVLKTWIKAASNFVKPLSKLYIRCRHSYTAENVFKCVASYFCFFDAVALNDREVEDHRLPVINVCNFLSEKDYWVNCNCVLREQASSLEVTSSEDEDEETGNENVDDDPPGIARKALKRRASYEYPDSEVCTSKWPQDFLRLPEENPDTSSGSSGESSETSDCCHAATYPGQRIKGSDEFQTCQCVNTRVNSRKRTRDEFERNCCEDVIKTEKIGQNCRCESPVDTRSENENESDPVEKGNKGNEKIAVTSEKRDRETCTSNLFIFITEKTDCEQRFTKAAPSKDEETNFPEDSELLTSKSKSVPDFKDVVKNDRETSNKESIEKMSSVQKLVEKLELSPYKNPENNPYLQSNIESLLSSIWATKSCRCSRQKIVLRCTSAQTIITEANSEFPAIDFNYLEKLSFVLGPKEAPEFIEREEADQMCDKASGDHSHVSFVTCSRTAPFPAYVPKQSLRTCRNPTESSYLDSPSVYSPEPPRTFYLHCKTLRKNSTISARQLSKLIADNRRSFQAIPEARQKSARKSKSTLKSKTPSAAKKTKKSTIPNFLCAPFSSMFKEFIREMVDKILAEKDKASTRDRKCSYISSQESELQLLNLQSFDSSHDNACSCSMKSTFSRRRYRRGDKLRQRYSAPNESHRYRQEKVAKQRRKSGGASPKSHRNCGIDYDCSRVRRPLSQPPRNDRADFKSPRSGRFSATYTHSLETIFACGHCHSKDHRSSKKSCCRQCCSEPTWYVKSEASKKQNYSGRGAPLASTNEHRSMHRAPRNISKRGSLFSCSYSDSSGKLGQGVAVTVPNVGPSSTGYRNQHGDQSGSSEMEKLPALDLNILRHVEYAADFDEDLKNKLYQYAKLARSTKPSRSRGSRSRGTYEASETSTLNRNRFKPR